MFIQICIDKSCTVCVILFPSQFQSSLNFVLRTLSMHTTYIHTYTQYIVNIYFLMILKNGKYYYDF